MPINGAPCGPPAADAGMDAQEECVSPTGSPVTLDGSGSSDPNSTPGTNDDIVFFEWFEDFGQPSETLLGTGQVIDLVFPRGIHSITLKVTDRFGGTSLDELQVVIRDTVLPEVEVDLSALTLWPPSHHLVPISASVLAADACSEPLELLQYAPPSDCSSQRLQLRQR